MEKVGLEPTTFWMQIRCSSKLSYDPRWPTIITFQWLWFIFYTYHTDLNMKPLQEKWEERGIRTQTIHKNTLLKNRLIILGALLYVWDNLLWTNQCVHPPFDLWSLTFVRCISHYHPCILIYSKITSQQLFSNTYIHFQNCWLMCNQFLDNPHKDPLEFCRILICG